MAYSITKYNGTKTLEYLPIVGETLPKTGRKVVFDSFCDEDVPQIHEIFKKAVDDGQTYPYETCDSIDDLKCQFLSHDAFVLRDEVTKEVLGGFYVKPNYPGRSSHICNGGFITKSSEQGTGIATFLVPKFLKVAKDLGYSASYFNLVYVSNQASIRLWEKYGFQAVGRIPNAGNLKGLGYIDALQYYYDLTTVQEGFHQEKKLTN